MRKIPFQLIVEKVKDAFIEINCKADHSLLKCYQKAIDREVGHSKAVMEQLNINAKLAETLEIPICQDTGTAVIFVRIGNQVEIEGGFIEDALNQGVEAAYREGYLRKSIVKNPFTRENTGTNLPAIIHYEFLDGESLIIDVAAKGGGSENMSALKMLAPSQGADGVESFVLDTVIKAGPNPCPPIIVGVGIGSNFEGVALLAKKALLRSLESENEDPYLRDMELSLENKINNTGIGPQGLGGKTTAFKVHILMAPCHIASLPVAVNINCHVTRHKEIVF